MAKPFFLGIDGGATSCRARIRDMDGKLLGEGESGPANIHSNFRLAMESIRLACEAALRSAGLDEQSLQHLHAHLCECIRWQTKEALDVIRSLIESTNEALSPDKKSWS